ncbi:DUF2637 domain-containing protein [Polymorphospora sp. NPDC051019]|uniref:DUF2637 domain-containing protein n=1 Tax=Polymorphospora sp. NPDC051019 TaxID=3155725 RepID=UPI00342D0A74
MTTPTLSAYPPAIEDLMPAARELAERLGTLPSQRRIKAEFHVGRDKANAILDGLRVDLAPPAAPVAVPTVEPTPDAPDSVAAPASDDGITLVPEITTDRPTPEVSALPTPVVEPLPKIVTDAAEVVPAGGEQARRRSIPGRVWAYIGVALGGVVSIAANVAHTYLPKPPPGAPDGWTAPVDWSPPLLAVAFSVFWPIALFVAVEILTRITWGDGFWSMVVRVVGVLPVALVAAVVSYRHLSGLLDHFGEDDLTVAIGPLAIDGLMVMASAALMATNRKRTKTS